MKTLALASLLALGVPTIAAAQDGGNVRVRVDQALAQFRGEPDVRAVQEAAVRFARANPEVYDGWLSSARWANLLPHQLRGKIVRLTRDETDVRVTLGTDVRVDLVTFDEHVRYEGQVEWDLSRLVFNTDQLRVASETTKLTEHATDVMTTVNKLYFARRELQLELTLNPPNDVRNALRIELRIASLTADLDALTGGWFSQQLGPRTGAAPRPGASSSVAASPLAP